jgi:hypothetical protein
MSLMAAVPVRLGVWQRARVIDNAMLRYGLLTSDDFVNLDLILRATDHVLLCRLLVSSAVAFEAVALDSVSSILIGL